MSNVNETTLQERQEAIRLAMRDALQHSSPGDLRPESFTVLSEGIDMLGWFTFSEAEEERWLMSMLEVGWYLCPAVDPAECPK